MYQICLLSFLLVQGLYLTKAEIITSSIRNNSHPLIHFKNFCFGRTGHVSITATNVSITSTKPTNSSLFSFSLFEYAVYLDKIYNCDIESSLYSPGEIHRLGTFEELLEASGNLNVTSVVPRAKCYGVYFTNCEQDAKVSMNIHLEMYNLEDDGTKLYVEYLNYQLPPSLLAFSGCYLVLLFVWVFILCNDKHSVYKIHTLLGLLLLVKSLSLLFDAKDRYTIMVTGSAHGWDTFYYMFYFIRCLLFSIVIMLVGIGWSFLRPQLLMWEKIFLGTGMMIQVFFSIAYTYMNILGPIVSETYWIVPFIVVDLLSTGIILFPFKVAMRAFKEAAETNGNVAWNLQKMRLLKEMFSCVLTYEYARRLVKFGVYMNNDDGCGMEFVDVILSETVVLVFYVAMFSMLHPKKQKEFLLLGQQTDEYVAMAIINGEEFEDV